MSEEVSLRDLVNPTPRQEEFLAAIQTHKYTLYGGAAGGGKSYILRWALVALLLQWAAQGHVGVRVGLFCEDYPSLRDRHLSKIKYEFPDWLGKLRMDPLPEFELAPRFGSGVITFRNLDDPSKYLSSEFAAIGVDELTRNEEQVFHILRMRLRWPGIDHCPFMGATNPGQIGHAWVQRLWIRRDFPPELQSQADEFCYIPAKATDNPHLSPSYIEALKSLPERLRLAYLDGRWDVFEGQVFTEFRPEIHTVDPFPIPHWWRRWRSNDPGFTDPFAWYWFAADPSGEHVYIYREYTRKHSDPRINYSDQAREVSRLSVVGTEVPGAGAVYDENGHPMQEKIDFTVTGMDAFTRHPETGKAIIDYYHEGGVSGLLEPVHGPGSRRAMAAVYHEYLRIYPGPDGKPTSKLKIFKTCPMLIETLPTLMADEKYPEQVAESANDHWYQASGYGLQAHYSNRTVAPTHPLTTEEKIWKHKDTLMKKLKRRFKWAKGSL